MHTNPQVLFEVDVFHQLYHSFLHSSILLRQSQFDPPFCRTKPHLKASRTLKRDPGRADRTGPVETTRLWSWVPVTGRLSEGGAFWTQQAGRLSVAVSSRDTNERNILRCLQERCSKDVSI